MFNFFKSKILPEFHEIFQTSNEQIALLEKYKPLQKEGKFEAVFLCANILFNYKKGYSNEVMAKYLTHLIKIRKNYGITLSHRKTFDLIMSRIDFYADEFRLIFNSQQFINGSIYNVLYENPLTFTPE